jgi:CheY-like chemotaxis protein
MAEAASQMRDVTKACAVVDAQLADMPGLEAVHILRQLRPHVKIIFTTPENTGDLEASVRALDVFYYYVGSADRAELVAAVREAVGSPRPERTGHAPTVLIVDDDHDFHATVRAILESAGYGTISAYSEEEGLDVARRDRPDAILLDIIMESTTDGFEFCREARRDPQIKHTPILGISAIDEKIGLHCRPDRDPDLFPVNGYLGKPVKAERLLAELRRLIPQSG